MPCVSAAFVPETAPLPADFQGSKSDANSARDGLTGLKALGVRDLHYRMCFMASSVHAVDTSFDWHMQRETSDGVRPETILEEFTAEERKVR